MMGRLPQALPRTASFVGALAIFGALGWALAASGLFAGSLVGQRTNNWLAGDTSTAAPAAPAFWIWILIYLGLAVYAVWQCFTDPRSSVLHSQIRGWVILAAVLNALWVQMLQWQQLGWSVVVMLALMAALIHIVWQIGQARLSSQADRWITRATFGLFLGWVLLTFLANFSAWLSSRGTAPMEPWLKGTTALVILFTGLAICALTFKNPMGIYVNAGALWAIVWVAVERFAGHLPSLLVAVCATVAALLMLLCLASSVRTRLVALRSTASGRE